MATTSSASTVRAPRSVLGMRTRPMLRTVFLKSLRDQFKAILGWGLGLAILAYTVLIFFPEIQKAGQGYDQMLQSMPFLKSMLGDIQTFTTLDGFVTLELQGYLPILLTIYVVLAATSTITGEIESGTMDFLLAHPLPRWRVVLEKYAALVVSLVAICAMLGVGMWLGALTIGQYVPVTTWALMAFNVLPITLFYGSVAFVLACAVRGRGIPLGVGAGLAVAGFILNGFVPMIDALKPYREFTIYYLFTASKPFTTGLNWGYIAILLAGALMCLVLSLFAFERRDITS